MAKNDLSHSYGGAWKNDIIMIQPENNRTGVKYYCHKQHQWEMENYKSIDKHPTQSTITQMYKEALNLIIENQLQNENKYGTQVDLLTEQEIQ